MPAGHRLPILGLLLLVSLTAAQQSSAAASNSSPASLAVAVVDYPTAYWVPASTSNYTVADRPHDYPVDFIVIHDIEGSYASAIKAFQNPTRRGSSHYIVSYGGHITQMVAEKNIAWHAGNWDYNTRSIGIEHEGYAYTPLYRYAEYKASAHLAASICSRWGVPMNRGHVIGHNQVPDPNNPKLFGGSEHHTDPGPDWNWTYYMGLARTYASLLPSPPHMVLQPSAFSGDTTATVTWKPARSCRTPIASYTVVAQPGNIQSPVLPGTATTFSFTGLTNSLDYTFTVTAHNSYGRDSATSNAVTPSAPCASVSLSANPDAPQSAGIPVQFTATSTGCNNPQYEFWVQDSTGNWVMQQPFGTDTWTWDSYPYTAGTHTIRVWANHATSDTRQPEAYTDFTYVTSAFSMTHWQAAYDLSGMPTTWVAGESQTFPVKVTNTGDATWTASGFGRVDLDFHFTTQAGGSSKSAYWLNSKAFSLPADLAPGASVTLNVTFAAPSTTGSLVLEAEMIKEHEFWFPQWASSNVSVAAAVWRASYDLSGVPATWVKGQSQTVTVTVTNTGNTNWPSGGYYRVDLDFHFTTVTGGSAKRTYWLTSKAYSMPASLAPGQSVTLTVSVVAPTTAGSMYLEAEMIKEHKFWFAQSAAVAVSVS